MSISPVDLASKSVWSTSTASATFAIGRHHGALQFVHCHKRMYTKAIDTIIVAMQPLQHREVMSSISQRVMHSVVFLFNYETGYGWMSEYVNTNQVIECQGRLVKRRGTGFHFRSYAGMGFLSCSLSRAEFEEFNRRFCALRS